MRIGVIPLLEDLIRYNSEMCRVFGACVEIRNTARKLQKAATEMELLASNGVVRAAKLTAGKGRSFRVLAEYLTEVPVRVQPEIDGLEEICTRLAANTAEGSNVVRLFYLLISGLLELRRSQQDFDPDEEKAARFTRPEEIEALMERITLAASDRHLAENAVQVGHLSEATVQDMRRLLRDSEDAIEESWRKLEAIQTVARTARYLAQCVAIEAARAEAGRQDFETLSSDINTTIDELEATLAMLEDASKKGRSLLRALILEVDTA